MNEPRYDIRQEKNGLWTVFDILTGLPAASDGRDLANLEREDAKDIADHLNREHIGRRRSPLL